MSTIISASLTKDDLAQLDAVQEQLGFSGRSETIRAGIRALAAEQKERSKLSGSLEASLLVLHDEHGAKDITRAIHEFQDVIKTHLHHHVGSERCLEILVLKGNAEKIKTLVETVQASKAARTVRLVVC